MKRIRIGNQTSAYAAQRNAPFAFAIENGFDAFEWFMDKHGTSGWEPNDLTVEEREEIERTAAEHDIFLSLHASSWCTPLFGAGRERLLEEVDLAQSLGAEMIVIHPDLSAGMDAFADALEPITGRAAEIGIELALENTPLLSPNDINSMFARLDHAHVPAGFCFDMGHANLCAATRNDFLRFINELDPEIEIVHIHLHENYGEADIHLPLFTGPSKDNPRAIELLMAELVRREYDGALIFEQWPDPPQLLTDARMRLRGMIAKHRPTLVPEPIEEPVEIVAPRVPTLDLPVRKARPRVPSVLPEPKLPADFSAKPLIIYNLFPLLAGPFSAWDRHFEQAQQMGFNWIFVNPVQQTGASGSLYSVKDYFSLNPLLVDASKRAPDDQLRAANRAAERRGIGMMTDLVINHCATDSPLINDHPEWFVHEQDGRVRNPSCMEDGKEVVWKDLAQFDHHHSSDPEGLFQYFKSVVRHLRNLGFRAFRCDAAYMVPLHLWERLIRETREETPDVLFLAETLGCRPKQTKRTAAAGFDLIFNSSKWWNLSDPWLLEQYGLLHRVADSVSFPESHDTERLAQQTGGNINAQKQRYLFAALFSAGVMTPMGYELGFRRRMHVAKSTPLDWGESTEMDLRTFIRQVNDMKREHQIFHEDGPTKVLDNGPVLFVWKGSKNSSRQALFLLNKDVRGRQTFRRHHLTDTVKGAGLIDVSPTDRLQRIPVPFHCELGPGEGKVFVTS